MGHVDASIVRSGKMPVYARLGAGKPLLVQVQGGSDMSSSTQPAQPAQQLLHGCGGVVAGVPWGCRMGQQLHVGGF